MNKKEFHWHNPIGSDELPTIRDPQILHENGVWYLTGSSYPYWGQENGDAPSPGVQLWKSDDLKDWKRVGLLIDRDTVPEDAWYRDRFWAPEIHKKKGRFYLTFNCNNCTGRIRRPHQAVGLAVADHIEGPYRILNPDTPLWDKANDGSLLTDDDGRTYLYVSGVWGCEVDLERAALLGEPKRMIEGVKGDWDGMIIEGPCAFKKGGRYFLLYSSNTRGYEVGYAVADHPMGPWRKGKYSPFFGAQSRSICESRPPHLRAPYTGDPESPYIGCGHNTIFTGPDGGLWVCAHYEMLFDPKNPMHRYPDQFPCGNPTGRNHPPFRVELLGYDPFWVTDEGDLVSRGPSYKPQVLCWQEE